jgi:hypothetical protein
MGVSLHYRGKIKSTKLITELTNEVEDICKTNNWSYTIFDDETHRPLGRNEDLVDAYLNDEDDDELRKPDLGLRGITFRPHEKSESVALLFDENGIIRSVLSVLFPYIQEDEKYPWSFIKTQFAGADAHVKVVNLLVYLQKKYFKAFKLKDDGGYYPEMDLDTLQKRMGIIDRAMDTIHDIFDNVTDPDEVIGLIEDALAASFKNENIRIIRFDPESFADFLKDQEDKNDNDEKKKEKKPRKRRKKDDDESDG